MNEIVCEELSPWTSKVGFIKCSEAPLITGSSGILHSPASASLKLEEYVELRC